MHFMVTDLDAKKNLVNKSIELLQDENEMSKLSTNIAAMGLPNASSDIVDEILRLVEA